jgi:monodechloroaminopyrrolnitrin synthase
MRSAISDLSGELEVYAEFDATCAITPHQTYEDLPLNFITSAEYGDLTTQPHDRLLIWHRDLCWCLSKEITPDRSIDLEKACQRLGTIIDEVPRDTVYTYASRACTQSPETFSGLIEEQRFILGLQQASKCLLSLTLHAAKLPRTATQQRDIEPLLAGILELNSILADVIMSVDASTFVSSIEPHFIRRAVLGREYYGPTAAQLPLVSFEALLYGNSASNELRKHALFQRAYMPATLRKIIDHAHASPPLLFEAIEEAASRQIEKYIGRFRRVHLAMARKAFALQASPSEKAKQILEVLLDHQSRTRPED